MPDITIRPLRESDIDQAGEIALALWGDEVPELPASLRPVIYQYLARYYFHRSSAFNFAAEAEGRLCGFLMAALPEQVSPRPADDWVRPRLPSPEDRKLFAEYRSYLEGNRKAEHAALRPGEILLLFFASLRKGAGRLLLGELENRMRAQNIPSLLLWTDETCDFDYYFRRGFQSAGHFPSPSGLCGHRWETWLFRKTPASPAPLK